MAKDEINVPVALSVSNCSYRDFNVQVRLTDYIRCTAASIKNKNDGLLNALDVCVYIAGVQTHNIFLLRRAIFAAEQRAEARTLYNYAPSFICQ